MRRQRARGVRERRRAGGMSRHLRHATTAPINSPPATRGDGDAVQLSGFGGFRDSAGGGRGFQGGGQSRRRSGEELLFTSCFFRVHSREPSNSHVPGVESTEVRRCSHSSTPTPRALLYKILPLQHW